MVEMRLEAPEDMPLKYLYFDFNRNSDTAVKLPNTKCHEIPLSLSRVVTCRHTHTHTERQAWRKHLKLYSNAG